MDATRFSNRKILCRLPSEEPNIISLLSRNFLAICSKLSLSLAKKD